MGIPVTSVEAERSYSASDLFITKLRSILNDNTLDALCILRAYFLLPVVMKNGNNSMP